MKPAVTIAVLSTLLCGCGHRDATLAKEIVGNWARDSAFETTLSPDGSFISHWAAPNRSLTYQGTWKIQNGSMITTITNCIATGYTITNFERSGSVDHFTIIRADAHDLVYSNDNQIISLNRK